AGCEDDVANSRNRHGLRGSRDETHLNTVLVPVVHGVVVELRHFEVGAQYVVDDVQDILVELGGDTATVVVRAFYLMRVLAQIDAEEKEIAECHQGAHARDQIDGCGGSEITDGAPEKCVQ